MGCNIFSSSEEATTTDSGDSGQPTLIAGDFSDVAPCRSRDTLPNDTTFLDVIKNAEQIIHIHDEYQDDDNLPAVCGVSSIDNTLGTGEVGWDPSEGTDVLICYEFGTNISDYWDSTTNNPGMCRFGFRFETEATFDGFPRAGNYRIDSCIEDGGNSYRVRVRIGISGDDVNKTLTQVELDDVEDLEFFDNDGTEVKTAEEAKALFIANPDGFVFTVRSGDGAKTHIEVRPRVICVIKQASACPTPTESCS